MENCRGERRESERERVVGWVGSGGLGAGGSQLREWALISQNHPELLEIKTCREPLVGPVSTLLKISSKVTASSESTSTNPEMCHTSAFPTCCHFEFGTALQKSLMHVRMFAKEVKTYVFRESVRLSSSCNFVAPQYAQTNLKHAQSIKARSSRATPFCFCCFSPVFFQAFNARPSFFKL